MEMFLKICLLFLINSRVEVHGACSDGEYCSEIFLQRWTSMSASAKCKLSPVGLAPDLYGFLVLSGYAYTKTSEYCPVTCGGCPAVTEAPTTIETTTEKPAEEKIKEIMSEHSTFANLLNSLTHRQGFVEERPETSLQRYEMYTENKKAIPTIKIYQEVALTIGIRYTYYLVLTMKLPPAVHKTEVLRLGNIQYHADRVVDKHNELFASGESSYKMGVNQFSIALPDELPPNTLQLDIPSRSLGKEEVKKLLDSRKRREADVGVDWRSIMQPNQNQGSCGGCWAFAMNGMVEGFFALKNMTVEPLSVQQLLDCDREMSAEQGVTNKGCNGGYFHVAAEYMRDHGVTSAEEYPFLANSYGSCALKSAAVLPRLASFDNGYVTVDDAEGIEALNVGLKTLVRKGPVAVGMAVGPEIYNYETGIFDGSCGTSINHAVVVVGFTADYWIIRNSWGSSWGESGHMRLARKSGEDSCMIARYWSQAQQIGTWDPAKPVVGGAHVVLSTSPSTSEGLNTSPSPPSDCCPGMCCECSSCDWDEDEDDEETSFTEDTTIQSTSTTESSKTTTTVGSSPDTTISETSTTTTAATSESSNKKFNIWEKLAEYKKWNIKSRG